MPAARVLDLDDPEISIAASPPGNQCIDTRLILGRQLLEHGRPIRIECRRVKVCRAARPHHLHQNIAPIRVATMHNGGECPAQAGAAQKG